VIVLVDQTYSLLLGGLPTDLSGGEFLDRGDDADSQNV
jgi:hypothetical protein